MESRCEQDGPFMGRSDEVWPSSSSVSDDAQWAAAIPTFEYILMAPTSAAVPIHDEPVTFLNQNKAYEVKCRKTDVVLDSAVLLFKTVITVCFESRKDRFKLSEVMTEWRLRNPGRRFLTFDITMCANVREVKYGLRSAEFVWNASEGEASVFIKFFVVSSDFITNAGEKGQPFRLVIQTFPYNSDKMIQQSSAQVQIYKMRGAERKRQTEREKAEKFGNREQFQPSYDYTILLSSALEYTVEQENRIPVRCIANSPFPRIPSPSVIVEGPSATAILERSFADDVAISPLDVRLSPHVPYQRTVLESRKRPYPSQSEDATESSREASVEIDSKSSLSVTHTAEETAEWLLSNRFGKYVHLFADFDGEDLLRLSLVQLTSLMKNEAHALRLFHAVRNKRVEPRILVYFGTSDDTYEMICLVDGTGEEVQKRIKSLISEQVDDFYVLGPSGIRVKLTDEIVQSWQAESVFDITCRDRKCILTPQR